MKAVDGPTNRQLQIQQMYGVRLARFQFPFSEDIQEYTYFANLHQSEANKIKVFIIRRMKEEIPLYPSIYNWACYRKANNKISYRLSCWEKCMRGKHACRAFFHFIYDRVQRSFTLQKYRNEHYHFPHNFDKTIVTQMKFHPQPNYQVLYRQPSTYYYKIEPAEQNQERSYDRYSTSQKISYNYYYQ